MANARPQAISNVGKKQPSAAATSDGAQAPSAASPRKVYLEDGEASLTTALATQIEQLIALHELVTREERERGNLAWADEEESDSAAMLHLLSPSRPRALDGQGMVRDRAEALQEAEEHARQPGQQQGPLLKPMAENVRIKDEQSLQDDDDEEEEDPDHPSDLVLDREAVKKNARALLKKKEKKLKLVPTKGEPAEDVDGKAE